MEAVSKEGGRWPTVSPRHVVPPHLINYNSPGKSGCGNKDALAVDWSGWVAVKDSAQLVSSGQ